MLGGDQPDEGDDAGSGEPVPVADLHRQGEPGQDGDPAQAPQSAHHLDELRVGSHLFDGRIESVAADQGGHHRLVVSIEGQQRRPLGQLRPLLTPFSKCPTGYTHPAEVPDDMVCGGQMCPMATCMDIGFVTLIAST